MAIKSKATVPANLQALFAQFLAQQQGAKPAQANEWRFDIQAQDGEAAVVMAHPKDGKPAFLAMARISDSGRVKLGFRLDAALAKGFHKLLGGIQ